ncbi:hypothetical protein Cfor_06615, partial [Coptotermes formosanus]
MVQGPKYVRNFRKIKDILMLYLISVSHAEILSKYNKKYGPVYRGWVGSRGTVTVSSPEAAEKILSSTLHINKSVEYEAYVPWFGDNLFLEKGQEWRKLRKLMSPAFSRSTLEIYLEVFKNNAEILVQALMTKVGGGEFDVCPYLVLYSLDCTI